MPYYVRNIKDIQPESTHSMISFIHQISFNWFLLYYFSLGLILLYQGATWYFKPQPFIDYLISHAKTGESPALIVKTLRYLFLFSALSVVLSLFPFSIVELIFGIWSFVMVYIIGSFFVKWKALSVMILENPDKLQKQIKKGGAMMLSLGVVMFLLAYVLLTNR